MLIPTTFHFIHDTFLILIRMFPHIKTCIRVTAISANARFDPHYHGKVGSVLRPLRYGNVLIIGSGGIVHDLYRHHWGSMVIHRDNFAQPVPPESWEFEFRRDIEDVFTRNSGSGSRRALLKLMKQSRYSEAHGIDDYVVAAKQLKTKAQIMSAGSWPKYVIRNFSWASGNKGLS